MSSFKTVFFILFFHLIAIFSIGQTVTFNYTGAVQNWTVPPCVTSINVTLAGAEGGGTAGGNGAVVTGTIAVTPGQVLNIYVGGSGNCPQAGWNGGGNGQNANSTANRSCGGGGATDIRIGGTALSNRVIVASGGGGMGGGTQDAAGGAGGCATGATRVNSFGGGGTGGTQSSAGVGGTPWGSGQPGYAGSLGQGANGAVDNCYNNSPGGGGGGGFYGGGSGGADCFSSSPYGGGAGGGGSSLTPSGGGCTSGSNNGPGYCTITYTVGAGSATATNTGPYCVGSTIQLTATGGTPTSTYAWTGPNGFTSSLQNPTIPSSTAANAGTYNLTVTSTGCTATASTTVVVNPLPVVNAGVDQTVCQGTNVTLSATGATTYSWSGGVTQNVAFAPPLGSTTYTVTGTTSGCTATDQVVVTVNANPVVNAGSDISICPGASTTLTANGATSYTWSPGGETTASITVAPSSTSTYTVVGTTAGCTGMDNVVVTVLPGAPINAGNDVAICEGNSTTLTAANGVSYTWDNGLGNGNGFTVSPVTTTTYNVTGTDANGCIGNDAVVVTVDALPIVSAGADQAVCTGTSVTLSGSGATTYSWSGGVSNGVSFIPTGTSTYDVTGTTPAGCTGTDQVLITVNPLPIVNAGNDQAVCAGTSVVLSATGTATTYSWSNGVTNGVAFTPTVSSNYTVTGTGAGNCTTTDDVFVTVNPIPAVNAGSDVVVCEGSTVVLTATGADTYNWDNNVQQGIGFIPTVGSLTYTVTGTTNAGCSSTDQLQVTVNANPVPVISGNFVYCAPSPPTLGTTQVYSGYSWSTGSTNSTIVGTQANNPVSVTVTSAEGCTGTSSQVNLTENNLVTTSGSITICQGETAMIHGNVESVAGNYSQTFTTTQGCDSTSTITLIVNPLPDVNAGSDQVICSGTSVSVNGSGAATYTWNNGVTNGVSFTPTSSMTLICTGTDLNGCVNTDDLILTVNSNPIVNAGPDQSVCSGSSVVLSGGGASTYTWDNGVSDNVSFVPNATLTYTVIGTTAQGCTGTDQVTVTVNPVPNVNAVQDQVVCEGTSVVLTAMGATTYSWNNGVSNGSAFVPSVGTTIYTVTGTSASCTDTDQVSVTVNPNPVVSFIADQTSGCTPLTVNFTNTSTNSIDCNWSITNGDMLNGCGSVQVTFEQGGCFDVTLSTTTSAGCTATFTAADFICTEEPPVANFAPIPQQVGMLDAVVNFNNTTTGAVDYLWDFGDNSTASTAENPVHQYPGENSGNYDVMLIAYSPMGCVDTAYSYVEVIEELIYYIPNSFTPDGDMVNQTFEPVFTSGFDPYDYNFLVFNRWGEIVFESNDHTIGWDGSYGDGKEVKTCQEGVYTWRIEFKMRNNDERKIISGHVNLLR